MLLTTLRRLRVARLDSHLVIAGSGPLREQLLRRAAALEIADRVPLVGEFEDVRPVLAAYRRIRAAVHRRRIIFECRPRGHVHGPAGDPLGHRRCA